MDRQSNLWRISAVINENNVITVFAEDYSHAEQKIERALNRPGRYHILERWNETGRQMVVDDDYSGIM